MAIINLDYICDTKIVCLFKSTFKKVYNAKVCFQDSKNLTECLAWIDLPLPSLNRFTTLIGKINFAILLYGKHSQ